MKTITAVLGIVLAGCASSSPQVGRTTGPDFVGSTSRPYIDESLVASSAKTRIQPLDVVAFKLDSEDLTEGGFSQVDTAARWLRTHPRDRIVLEGHTDLLGISAYNEDLATRRINTVRARLARHGIAADRIVMVTYGEAEAIIPENPNDRRVVMFASDQPVQQIVQASLEHRQALVAVWSEGNALLQLEQGYGRPTTTTVISRR